VRRVAFRLGFEVVIVINDIANGRQGRKTFVLLDCEKSGKCRKYWLDVDISVTGTRKCNCLFKL